jgi:hypothetical protein
MPYILREGCEGLGAKHGSEAHPEAARPERREGHALNKHKKRNLLPLKKNKKYISGNNYEGIRLEFQCLTDALLQLLVKCHQ